MTTVYEVRTKHTKKMLKDFLQFREDAWNINWNFRFGMLTICGLTLMIIGWDEPVLRYVSLGIALLFSGFGVIRRPIGVHKLSLADEAYQKQSDLVFVFGEKEFRLENSDTPEQNAVIKYGEVEFMYADDTYFFINVNNEDLHMIPKADFVMGDPEEFKEFFAHKTGKEFQVPKIPLKTKLGVLKQAFFMAREENSAKLKEKEANRKNKKNKK